VVFLHAYGAARIRSRSAEPGSRSCPIALRLAAWPGAVRAGALGRQWFPLTFRDPNERWLGVNKAALMLKRFLDAGGATSALHSGLLPTLALRKVPRFGPAAPARARSPTQKPWRI
jgi:hypothetical protein